jgi:hypothetical protein
MSTDVLLCVIIDETKTLPVYPPAYTALHHRGRHVKLDLTIIAYVEKYRLYWRKHQQMLDGTDTP